MSDVIESVRFVCLGPPRPKARPRVTAFGTFTPRRTKQYEHAIKAMAAAYCGHWRQDGQYRVTLDFVSQRALPGDTDNYAKACLDGLEGVAFANDRQVVEVRARKVVAPDDIYERTEVLVERVGDAPVTRRRGRRA